MNQTPQNMLPPVATNQTMATQVMHHVRDLIQEGHMTVGTWYSVYQLSEQLGISRSPVREGLLRLEEAGLIEFVRNRGFRIVETKPSDVADIFGLRLAIEPIAAARAARDRTPEQLERMHEILEHMASAGKNNDETAFFHWDQTLHDLILEAGHTMRGRALLKQLRSHTRILSDSTVRKDRSINQVHSEHLPIVLAIQERDPESAREAMAEHITATGRLLLRQAIQRNHPDLSVDSPELLSKVDDIWFSYTAQV